MIRGTISSDNKTQPQKQQQQQPQQQQQTPPSSLSVTQQPQDKGASVGSGGSGDAVADADASSRSPVHIRPSNATSPMSPASPTSSPTSPLAKRFQSSVSPIKRGRSYSKDSQKSSQSDLSLLSRNASGGGSPKLLAKTPLRAAKKRDVRNLSISPTDLGPPPKSQQTAKGQSTHVKQNGSGVTNLLLKKTTTTTSTDARNAIGKTAAQCSPKPLGLAEQLTKPNSTALAANNVNINSSHSSNSTRTNNNNTTNNNHNLSSKNALRHSLPTTKKTSSRNLNECDAQNKEPLATNVAEAVAGACAEAATHANDVKAKTIALAEESKSGPSANVCSCQAAEVELCAYCQNNNQRKLTENLEVLPDTWSTANKVQEKPSSDETLIGNQQQAQPQQQQQQLESSTQAAESVCTLPTCGQEATLARMQNFKRLDGSLDLRKLEIHLQRMDRQSEEYERRITGMGCVVQYFSEALEAQSCAAASKEECLKNQQELNATVRLLEESRRSCDKLQQQLDSQTSEYAGRETQQLALHRCEIEQLQTELNEVNLLSKQHLCEYERQTAAKDEQHKRAMDIYQSEMCRKLSYSAEKLQISEGHVLKLQQQVQLHEANELELHSKLTNMENQCARRLKAANEREDELNNCIKSLTKELNALRREQLAYENRPAEDVAYWRNKKREIENIIDYARTELQSRLDEQTALNEKIAKLEADDDKLRTELTSRKDNNNDLQHKYEKLEVSLNRSYAKQQSLCSIIEEQELQLKQRCKQLHIIEAKLQELPRASAKSNGCAGITANAEYWSTAATCSGASNKSHSTHSESSATGRKISGGDDMNWRNEAESLRSVLELKQNEISKINKEYAEIKRRLEEQSTMNKKISKLESDNELLRMELESKSDSERELQRQIEHLQGALSHSNTKRQRLSYDNEELQYLLKQRSQQLHLVQSKLKDCSSYEISLSCSSISFNNSHRSLLPSNGSNGTGIANSSVNSNVVDGNSPPASPIVKGVIEKNESVSWVLEMDDETPEVAASKMVKRASSLRSSVERSPTQKRQYSLNACSTPTNGSSADNTNGSLHIVGPNPLSQSMSATAIRQHSNDATISRTRSQSVVGGSVGVGSGSGKYKSNTHKVQRQLSSGGSAGAGAVASAAGNNYLQIPGHWNEPMAASTSSNGGLRPRTSTMKQQHQNQQQFSADPNELFCRSKDKAHLITCDTLALNSGERLDMHTFPKALEKFQQIQESAGEAMVSATNSEDESCSASSDDIVSLSSASRCSTGSMTQQQQQQLEPANHSSHMSIDEMLLLERGNSPSTRTPMDVSWSEDVEAFSNDSAA